MTEEFTGGCACGAFTFRCNAEPFATIICHCHDCQKSTGGPFGVIIFVPQESLALEKSKNADFIDYKVEGNTGNEVTRRACSQCSAPLIGQTDSLPGLYGLSVGSLDNSDWVTPQAHCWTSRKQHWVKINDDLPQFEKAPKF